MGGKPSRGTPADKRLKDNKPGGAKSKTMPMHPAKSMPMRIPAKPVKR